MDVDAGGRPALLAVLAAMRRRGLVAVAIEQIGQIHQGGTVFVPFDGWYPIADLTAVARDVVTAAGLPEHAEIWPRPQLLRLAFGYHTRNQTRGTLLTQDGARFGLDDDDGFAAAVAFVCTIAENSPPPAAPTTTSGQWRSTKDLIATFNAEHALAALLEQYGGRRTRDGWACN